MKKLKLKTVLLLLFIFFLSSSGFVFGQSKKQRATNWFHKGIAEQGTAAKIDAYKRAIELDPTFTEAEYNLALVYRNNRDYPRAAQHFEKALQLNNNQGNANLQLQITFELAKTFSHIANYSRAETLLRDAKNQTNKSELLAGFSWELGQALYRQGKFQQAIQELKECERLSDRYSRDAGDLIAMIRNEAVVQQQYDKARESEADGDFEQAIELYDTIKISRPDYLDVVERATRLRSILREQDKEKTTDSLYALARTLEREKKYDEASNILKNILADDPEFTKAADMLASISRNKQNETKQKAKQDNSDNKEKERLYTRAMQAMESGDLQNAVPLLQQLAKKDKYYKDVQWQLATAQKKLREKKTDKIKDKQTTDLAATKAEDASSLKSESDKVDRTLDGIYLEALSLVDQGQYLLAINRFEQIRAINPNFRDVEIQLVHTRAMINSNVQVEQPVEQDSQVVQFSMMFLGAGLLIGLGVVFAMPCFRVQAFLLIGQEQRAIAIFEGMLQKGERNPQIYTRLAELYFRTKRFDANALKIFSVVYDLKLPCKYANEIAHLLDKEGDQDALQLGTVA